MDSNHNNAMGMRDDIDEGTGTGHIWLRYATHFSVGERTYTIDMGIPVPLGADEETRERLLREADAGMDQLSQHVERRVAQVQRSAGTIPGTGVLPSQKSSAPSHAPVPASTSTSTPAPTPSVAASPRPASTPARAAASRSTSQGTSSAASTPSAPPPVPAASAPARETPTGQMSAAQSPQSKQSTQPPQPAQPSQATQKSPVVVPPTRPNIGASMPLSPGLPGGTMQLPQFLQYIKEMGLDARQAMDLLKVKSLSGLNLRDALEQLQHIVMKEGGTAPMPTPTQSQASQTPQTQRSKTGESGTGSNPGSGRQATSTAGPASTGASSTPSNSTRPASSPNAAATPLSSAASPMPSAPQTSGSGKSSAASGPKPVVIQEERGPYRGFDEEEDGTDAFEADLDEEEDEFGTGIGPGLSAADRKAAEDTVERLREAGGSAIVNAGRLNALHNVIGDQVQPEQLQALIRGIWGATSEKKLKNEQAEALIFWGKQDDFVTEAEMVLALFEEDADARSDR